MKRADTLSGYELQVLSYQDNLVEFMWCMEDLRIIPNNVYKDISYDDVKPYLDEMRKHGLKPKLEV